MTIIAHARLTSCLLDLLYWFKINSLQINPTKTQITYISQNKLSKPQPFNFTIGATLIESSPFVTNLGVIFDHLLDMRKCISNKIRNINHQLYAIKKVRKSLTFLSCKTLVTGLVLSIFDYCNSLLCHLPRSTLKPLISLQRYAVRIISPS